jgi:hypothetical protein
MQTKVKSKRQQTSKISKKKEFSFPLEKENFMIIGLGIVLLVIGYILMAENSVDGFMPTVVAPLLLVAGYCVVIPYGIMKKPKSELNASKDLTAAEAESSSNIKAG